jgi:hypothetical protein
VPLSFATVAVLRLSGEDAPPLEVAQHALAVAGYLDPVPIGALWNEDSPAVAMLNHVVYRIDNLPYRPTVADRRRASDSALAELTDAEVTNALADLDEYIRTRGGKLLSVKKQRDLLRRLVQRVAYELAKKLDIP